MSTLVVADSRVVYLAGLKWVLLKAGHEVVSECENVVELPSNVQRHRPDVVIVGLDIADPQTATLSSRLRATHGVLGIIFILHRSGALDIKDIQGLGADGLLLDGISHRSLIECVKAVADGGKWIDEEIVQNLLMSGPQPSLRLTGRETEIADLVSRGLRNKTIADRLHLSEGTVKMHLHHVYAKLHLRSRAELAWAAHGKGADRPNTDLL
jgi:two-component system nitrate/nitrite response regulator NarL